MKLIILLTLIIPQAFASYVTENFFVKLKKGKSLPETDLISKSKNLFGELHIVYADNQIVARDFFKSHPDVAYVEGNHKGERQNLVIEEPLEFIDAPQTGMLSFKDPYYSRLWAFKSSVVMGMGVDDAYVNFPRAHKDKIIVAVVDTGVDYNHPDLKNQMWVNKNEIAGNGIDDDLNGYIDDVHGINLLIKKGGKATGNPMDGHMHGTHVAGTIAAAQNNGVAIAGVSSHARIMAIRAVPNSGDETDLDVIEAFLYAGKNGAKIINCSFGKYKNEKGMAVSDAIKHIGDKYDTLVIAAAGNENNNIDKVSVYPASYPNSNLLVVAATTNRGRKAYFSNYGPKNVDLAAPGVGIYSTTPGSRVKSLSGTSMSSPNTAGVAAEILSQYPELKALELKKIMMDSVTKSARFKGKVGAAGMLNLNKALKAADDFTK